MLVPDYEICSLRRTVSNFKTKQIDDVIRVTAAGPDQTLEGSAKNTRYKLGAVISRVCSNITKAVMRSHNKAFFGKVSKILAEFNKVFNFEKFFIKTQPEFN